jgi:hypothetical protein
MFSMSDRHARHLSLLHGARPMPEAQNAAAKVSILSPYASGAAVHPEWRDTDHRQYALGLLWII